MRFLLSKIYRYLEGTHGKKTALSRRMGIERYKCENPYNRIESIQIPIPLLVKSAKKEQSIFLAYFLHFAYFEIEKQSGYISFGFFGFIKVWHSVLPRVERGEPIFCILGENTHGT